MMCACTRVQKPAWSTRCDAAGFVAALWLVVSFAEAVPVMMRTCVRCSLKLFRLLCTLASVAENVVFYAVFGGVPMCESEKIASRGTGRQ